MVKPANVKRRIERAKKKVEELEELAFEHGCDYCDELNSKIEDLYCKIHKEQELLKQLLR